jgi:hypothetical protein
MDEVSAYPQTFNASRKTRRNKPESIFVTNAPNVGSLPIRMFWTPEKDFVVG